MSNSQGGISLNGQPLELHTTQHYNDNTRINRQAYLEACDVPCVDCGLRWHPIVMTLDHLDRKTKYVSATGKRMSPGKMLTYAPAAFREVLKLCEAVCSNCHKIRENKRDKVAYMGRWAEWTNNLDKGALLTAPNNTTSTPEEG